MVVTQKDIHNMIVENATPFQKQYISMQCGYNPQKIKAVEQTMANIVNGIKESLMNSGTDYLNTRIE